MICFWQDVIKLMSQDFSDDFGNIGAKTREPITVTVK